LDVRLTSPQPSSGITIAMLRGEAASLREAEASQPRDMPDDYHPPILRRNPEDIDLGAIKADLEFLTERVERFRREQAPNRSTSW
jgi:hypothetical protein